MFQRIRGANLTIKPSKCHLGGREVSVVGHIVGKGQIKVQPDKVRAVKEYPRPRSKKDVRSFLGLSGYYRKHIKNFSELALPLTDFQSGSAQPLILDHLRPPVDKNAYQNQVILTQAQRIMQTLNH
jgi:hypothetical protein